MWRDPAQDPFLLDLSDPARDQLVLDRLPVQLLQEDVHALPGSFSDFLVDRGWILVATVDPIQV